MTSGKLNEALADANERAESIFQSTVKALAEQAGVTEQLKAADPMVWIRKMNNIRQRADEIVRSEIFAL